jgi:hemerythrin
MQGRPARYDCRADRKRKAGGSPLKAPDRSLTPGRVSHGVHCGKPEHQGHLHAYHAIPERCNVEIIWHDELSVGHPLLDEQHRALVSVINKLSAHDNSQKNDAEFISEMLTSIQDYIRTHFDTEERLLAQIDYPELLAHQQSHNRFLEDYSHICMEVMLHKGYSIADFHSFLTCWLENHLLREDMAYKPFITRTAPHN